MPIQNHIHLSTTLGGAPENSPDMLWQITDRRDIPVVILNIRRGLTGKLRPSVLIYDGQPVQLTNFNFTVKIKADEGSTTKERMDALRALYGKRVYFCDSYHADDDSDHTSDVRTMFVSEVGEFKVDHIKLDFYYVNIKLEDDTL